MTRTIFLGVTSVVLLAGGSWLLVDNVWLSLTASFADDQTQVFQEMRDEALSTEDPHRAANCLEGVVSYYPSGTKQRTGSHLDAVVERHRNDAIVAIIRRLRELTGKDLRNDSDLWVKEFCKYAF